MRVKHPPILMISMLLTLPAAPFNHCIQAAQDQEEIQRLTLEQCLEIALARNPLRPASQYAIEAAEARQNQARSTWWPQIDAGAAATVLDQAPQFLFPASTVPIPALPLGGMSLELPPVQVPEQKVKLMDRRNLLTSLSLTYPLYTGGLLSSLRRQADSGVEIAKQEARHTELEIMFEVKSRYYGAVLARCMRELAEEAVARLSATLDLTENLYLKGSGRVKKTDFLKNKMVVESARSILAGLKDKEELARAALLFSLGMESGSPVELADTEIPYESLKMAPEKTLETALRLNPDWGKFQSILEIFEAKIAQARSSHFPKVAVIGRLNVMTNEYDYGMMAPENRQLWMAGVGLEIPLFNGFRTRNKVKETRARLAQLRQNGIAFREGISLRIKQLCGRMNALEANESCARAAMEAAVENQDLTERAYQIEAVTEEDLIEAQILASLMRARYLAVRYEHYTTGAELDKVVGAEIVNLLGKQ